MNSKNFQTFFDCGYSKIRAGTFNIDNNDEAFYTESKFFTNQTDIKLKFKRLLTPLKKTQMNILIKSA